MPTRAAITAAVIASTSITPSLARDLIDMWADTTGRTAQQVASEIGDLRGRC